MVPGYDPWGDTTPDYIGRGPNRSPAKFCGLKDCWCCWDAPDHPDGPLLLYRDYKWSGSDYEAYTILFAVGVF